MLGVVNTGFADRAICGSLILLAQERLDGLGDFQVHVRQRRHGIKDARQTGHCCVPSAFRRGLDRLIRRASEALITGSRRMAPAR